MSSLELIIKQRKYFVVSQALNQIQLTKMRPIKQEKGHRFYKHMQLGCYTFAIK